MYWSLVRTKRADQAAFPISLAGPMSTPDFDTRHINEDKELKAARARKDKEAEAESSSNDGCP